MSYSKTVWKDREVSRPRTYTFQSNGDGSTTLIPSEGSILTAGTPLNATNLNKIENYLELIGTYTEVSEKGAVSNGHYIRWSHGWQLCWGMATFNVTTGGMGALFAQTLPTKALPASFSHTTYYIGFTPYFTEAVGIDIRSKAQDFFEPRVWTSHAVSNKTCEFGFIALGRWYE